jgi:hypothetical protein
LARETGVVSCGITLSDGGQGRTVCVPAEGLARIAVAVVGCGVRSNPPSLKVMPHGTLVEVVTRRLPLRCAPRSKAVAAPKAERSGA